MRVMHDVVEFFTFFFGRLDWKMRFETNQHYSVKTFSYSCSLVLHVWHQNDFAMQSLLRPAAVAVGTGVHPLGSPICWVLKTLQFTLLSSDLTQHKGFRAEDETNTIFNSPKT